ncbi:MAG: PTS sugar transporter subunit IIA [Thiobacillaceae bacterium]|nr:PTS sugar transporter subunit IIA [Thiobacillaceae bacterium]MCX7672936.1 PTS sugar transporter subunit IIA [Thiobacillaceae bacterium]MDW8323949.1 PTS sugar transporter subunit IIA [Burkholderiales bacterium]
MIGLLVVAHGSLGDSLIECATHVLGQRPRHLLSLDLSSEADPERLLARARERIAQLDEGDGVLILADIYGATPCNTVCRLVQPGRVEAVAGASLPMLLKAITYRGEPLPRLADHVVQGARESTFHIHAETCDAGA